MSKFISTIIMSLTLFAAPVLAGGGHGHSHGPVNAEITSKEVTEKAKAKIAVLVKAQKIIAGWAALEPESVMQKNFSKGPEWLITFKNIQVKDTTKQTLYMFYTLDGQYIAANYTGG